VNSWPLAGIAGSENVGVELSPVDVRDAVQIAAMSPTSRAPGSGSSSIWLWSVSMGTSFCTVGLIAVLAYWYFA